jgi:hypothetical protein
MEKILLIGGDESIHSYWRNYFGHSCSSYFLGFALTKEDGMVLLESQPEWTLIAVSSFVRSSKEPIPRCSYRVLNTLGIIAQIREKYPETPVFGLGIVEKIGNEMLNTGCCCFTGALDAPDRIIKHLETSVANGVGLHVTG